MNLPTGIPVDHRQDRNAYNRAYHRLRREEIAARKRKYYLANADDMRAKGRDHYHRNRARYRAYAAQYAKDHPEKMVDYVARRRALAHGAERYDVIDREL